MDTHPRRPSEAVAERRKPLAISLDAITKGKAVKAPRIVLLGTEKAGKSTFAAGADSPVFIPIKGEEGIDALDVARFPVAQSYEEVLECLRALYKEKHTHKTVVLDSSSTFEPLVWDAVCNNDGADSIERVGGGYGKGYTEALKYWRKVMDALDALRAEKDMASIIIGHVTVKTFNDPLTEAYDQFRWDIHTKAADAGYRWSDCILFVNTRTLVKKEDQGFNKKKSRGVSDGARYLYTQRRPAHPGGGRGPYGQLPYELPLEWEAFSNAVKEAS